MVKKIVTYFLCAIGIAIVVLSVESCNTQKSVMFQKGANLDSLNLVVKKNLHTNHELILQKNDILLITLLSNNAEFLKLFEMGTESNARIPNSYSSGMANLNGYVIDQKGFISVPIIGEIQADKRKISEVKFEITSRLKEFITDPIVNVKLVNFKVTVLGEVRSPGTINIPNEKISLLELLGITNGITSTADLRKAKLIREKDGEIKEYTLDLSKSDIVFSDKFFLCQNDILYIPPNDAKTLNSTYSPVYISVITTILSALITTINFLLK
jgi:polysaccharide export outer membrane protein